MKLPIVRGSYNENFQSHNPFRHDISHKLCPPEIHSFLKLVSSILVLVYQLWWQGSGPAYSHIFNTLSRQEETGQLSFNTQHGHQGFMGSLNSECSWKETEMESVRTGGRIWAGEDLIPHMIVYFYPNKVLGDKVWKGIVAGSWGSLFWPEYTHRAKRKLEMFEVGGVGQVKVRQAKDLGHKFWGDTHF